MNAIVAVSEDFGIGREGGLLFPLREDMRYFRRMTLGKTLIIGRKTLDSFPGGRPLPNRRHIVFTRDPAFEREGVTVVHDLAELAEAVRDIPEEELFVAGGGQIYRLLLPYCRTLYVTRVKAQAEAEVFFPDLRKEPSFRLMKRSAPLCENGIRYYFCVYERTDTPALL